MEFVEGKCPKCGGELRLPKDFETVLCMYCGKELTPSDFGWVDESINFSEQYEYTLEHMPEILLSHKNIMETFKKNLYEDSMKDYTQQTKHIFEALDKACKASPKNLDKILKECGESFINAVKADLDQDKELKNKKKRNDKLENYKVILALFTIPMLELQRTNSALAFSEVLMSRWVEEYPNMVFQKGTYDDINGGFRKTRFCYITTAVCETLNKPDDCYELTMFRQFRDDFMLKQPNGAALVQEYYDLAPTIVQCIDQRSDRNQVYETIWKNNLADCLKNIEMGNPEACMEHYMTMVQTLQQEYM